MLPDPVPHSEREKLQGKSAAAKYVIDRGEDLRYQMIGRYRSGLTWETMNFKRIQFYKSEFTARGNDALGFWDSEGKFSGIDDLGKTGEMKDVDADGLYDINLEVYKKYKGAPPVHISGRFLQNNYTMEEGHWHSEANPDKEQACQIKISLPHWIGFRMENGNKVDTDVHMAFDLSGLIDGFHFGNDKFRLWYGEIMDDTEEFSWMESTPTYKWVYQGKIHEEGAEVIISGKWFNITEQNVWEEMGEFELRRTSSMMTLDW